MSLQSLIDEQLLAQFLQQYTSQTRSDLEVERREMFSQLTSLRSNLEEMYIAPWKKKYNDTQELLRASQQRVLETSQQVSNLKQEHQKEKRALQKKLSTQIEENNIVRKQLEELRIQLRTKTKRREQRQERRQKNRKSEDHYTEQKTTKVQQYGHVLHEFGQSWMLLPADGFLYKDKYFEVTEPYWITVSCFDKQNMSEAMMMCNGYSESVGLPRIYEDGILNFGGRGFRVPTMTELLLAYQRLTRPPYRRLWTCEGSDKHSSLDAVIQDPYMPSKENIFATLTLEGGRLEERKANGRNHRHRFHMLLPTREGYDTVFNVYVP